MTSKPAPVLLCASTLNRAHSRPRAHHSQRHAYKRLRPACPHKQVPPAHTNKHQMPAYLVKSAISKHREKEARDKAREADRQEKLKKQIKDSVTCRVCYNPFKSSHKHIARMLACGHSFCSLCLEVDLPLMYISRDQPLACPLCSKKFPGDRYLAPRNYALMDIAEALSDAENPNKRVGAGDRSPSQKTLRRSARLQGATMAPA